MEPDPAGAAAPGQPRKTRRRTHARAAPGEGSGGGREPGQERIPGQYEPRGPHAHERRHRHDRAAARHAAGFRPARICGDGPRERREPAEHHQRHPGLLEDRGRQAGFRERGLQPPRHGRKHAGHDGGTRPGEGHRAGNVHAARGAAAAGRRSRPVAADPHQSDRQRDQVHRTGARSSSVSAWRAKPPPMPCCASR